MKSSKRARFEKVAAKRVDKVLEGFRLLGNCSNSNNYEYSKEDVELMYEELKKALRGSQTRFENELNRSEQKRFRFK